jgi:hypothetical protein
VAEHSRSKELTWDPGPQMLMQTIRRVISAVFAILAMALGNSATATGDEVLGAQQVQASVGGRLMPVTRITVDLDVYTFTILSFPDLRTSLPGLDADLGGLTVDAFRQLTGARLVAGALYLVQYQPPVAWGLVKVDNKVLSPPVMKSWALSALLCMNDGHPTLSRFDASVAAAGSDCLQTGPMLIERGKSLDFPGYPDAARSFFEAQRKRRFLCAVPGKLIFGATASTSARALVDSLLSESGVAGVACDAAAIIPGAAYVANTGSGTDELFPYVLAVPGAAIGSK